MTVSRDRARSVVCGFEVNDHDQQIIDLLARHRVMTTTQLALVTARSERTVCYRLSRLYRQRLVGRARPYRDAGSAPLHWWLTPAGARVAVADAAGTRSVPNPLFLAHAAATAGLWAALAASGQVVEWRREEEAWEEWPENFARHRLAPDALVVLPVGDGVAQAFVEIDMGTMTHRRLRAKLERYFAYARRRAWEGRHPHCPALLLLTTSERRAETFLESVERRRPKPSPHAWDDELHTELVVAASGAVNDPDSAASAAVWRTGPDEPSLRLDVLLGGVVAAERRRAATQAALHAEAARRAPMAALDQCLKSADYIARQLADHEAGTVLCAAMGTLAYPDAAEREAWAANHADLLIATADWSWEADKPGRAYSSGPTPPEIVAGWRALRPEAWRRQAQALVDVAIAQGSGDPLLRRLAAKIAGGDLVTPWFLNRVDRVFTEVRKAEAEALGDHPAKRANVVAAGLASMTRRERRRADPEELARAFDSESLLSCAGCGVARQRPSRSNDEPCPLCWGSLVPWPERTTVPPTEDSLTEIAARLDKALPSVSGRPW